MNHSPSIPPSYFRYKPEPVNRQRWNWQQWVYIAFIVVILCLLTWYVMKRILFVEGVGHLVLEQVEIKLKDDAMIEEIFIQEGKKAKKGDKLFRYNLLYHEYPLKDTTRTVIDTKRLESYDVSVYEATILNLMQDKARIAAKLQEVKLSSEACKTQMEESLLQLQLGVITRTQYDQIQHQCKENELNVSSLAIELKSIDELILKVPKQQAISTRTETSKFEPQPTFKGYYASPISGKVVRWNKKEHELVLAGESIVGIQSLAAPYILAYFEQSDAEFIQLGNEVSIEFSNNEISKGKIDFIYPTTVPLPVEFNDVPNIMVKALGVKIRIDQGQLSNSISMNNYQVKVKISNDFFRFLR